MLDDKEYERIARVLPLLQHAEAPLVQDFQRAAFFAKIPVGSDVFLEGDRVDAIALLISGVVRVYKIGETGREITLYRFGNGQSCNDPYGLEQMVTAGAFRSIANPLLYAVQVLFQC